MVSHVGPFVAHFLSNVGTLLVKCGAPEPTLVCRPRAHGPDCAGSSQSPIDVVSGDAVVDEQLAIETKYQNEGALVRSDTGPDGGALGWMRRGWKPIISRHVGSSYLRGVKCRKNANDLMRELKCVVDGTLLRRFAALEAPAQEKLAHQIGTTPQQLLADVVAVSEDAVRSLTNT